MTDATQVPGFICFDHVAIAVPPGELEAQVQAYKALGFTEIHREDVLGTDRCVRCSCRSAPARTSCNCWSR